MQGLFREPEHKLLAATCREKNVPVALVQQLIELELSDKRHGVKGRVNALIEQFAAGKGSEPPADVASRGSVQSDASPGAYRFLSIRMKNFCVFQDAELSFLWDPARPLCLIEGNNGSGKTKIIEAIRFALYDTRKPEALLHRDAPRPEARVEVELVLSAPSGEPFTLRRFIDFAFFAGRWTVQRTAFVAKTADGERALQDREAQDWVNERLPQNVVECFVFDAESSPVAALAESGDGDSVAEQLERVLGISVLREVIRRLDDTAKTKQGELATLAERPSVRQARAALEETDAGIEKSEGDTDELSRLVADLCGRKTIVDGQISDLLAKFDPAGERAREEKRRAVEEARRKEDELKAALRDQVGGVLPLQLIAKSIEDAIELSRLGSENEDTDAFRQGAKDALRQMARLAVEGRIPWSEDPMPFAPEIEARLVRLLELPERPDVEDRFALPETQMWSLSRLVEHARKQQVCSELVRDLRKVLAEGPLRGDSVADRPPMPVTDLRDQYAQLIGQRDDLQGRLAKHEAKLAEKREARKRLAEAREQQSRHLKDAERNEHERELKRKECELAALSSSCVDRLAELLRTARIDALEAGATEVFKKTTNKPELYARVVFDRSSLRYHVRDFQDRQAPLDRSTGERAVLSLAVVHGLQQASGRGLPLVMEAPFKPLDPAHTDKVVRHAFNVAAGQVILLVKPAEIPVAHEGALESRVGQRFELVRPDPKKELSTVRER
jgi:DNA sulfur modification protein DndD